MYFTKKDDKIKVIFYLLKNSSMLNLIRNFLKPKYQSLNYIEIDKKNILYNLSFLQKQQQKAEIFPVIKSNAYWHGIKEMCFILNKTDIKTIVVDSFPEYQIVHKHSNKNILVLGEQSSTVYKYFDFKRTEFCIYNIETLKMLSKFKKNIKIHLFANTWMNREGIKNMKEFLRKSKRYLSYVQIIGFCSHLASADVESDMNQKQQLKFFQDLDILNENKFFPKWVHLGNSAWTFILKDVRLTAFRNGIAMFGYNVFEKNHPKYKVANKLKPALSIFSKINSIQELKKGDIVAYNETFIAKQSTKVASIPFWYFEWLNRLLSNKWCFYDKQGNSLPIAWRVCMNISCVEIKKLKLKVGDIIEIVSSDKRRKNSINKIAEITGTIPYEILVGFNSWIRKVINNG